MHRMAVSHMQVLEVMAGHVEVPPVTPTQQETVSCVEVRVVTVAKKTVSRVEVQQ